MAIQKEIFTKSNIVSLLPRVNTVSNGITIATILHLFNIGPRGVRALPLAAGINVGGHYFAYIIPLFSSLFSSLFLPPLFKTTEGVVVGFQIFAWAPKYHKY